uniref:Potassium channel domain-containing protein n=1 Tax=Kalanchoe fedtschenkoi TaxID=63787 RepID=A0A7N0UED3_KALFE
MAHDDALQALLTEHRDSSPNHSDRNALKRRKYGNVHNPSSGMPGYPEPNSYPASVSSTQLFSLKQVLFILAAYLGAGALCFFLARNQLNGKKTNGAIDALYFCVVTMTTVGYGDLVPGSTTAKLLACIFVFSGVGVGGLFLSKAADYIIEKQELQFVKALHKSDRAGQAEIIKEAETNKMKYKFIVSSALLLVIVIVGILFLHFVEGFDFVDAFYCVCSTITTLGYGDESFSTGAGRLFAVFWILSGTACVAQFFLYLTEMYAERRQKAFFKWVVSRRLTSADLEEADLDHDKVVSAAEFILFKLREMEKISQDDVHMLLERFHNLDADHSGTLTAADLISPLAP